MKLAILIYIRFHIKCPIKVTLGREVHEVKVGFLDSFLLFRSSGDRVNCWKKMAVSLPLTIFFVVSTSTCALVTKHPGNETLSVLLLASTAAGYNSSLSTLYQTGRTTCLLRKQRKIWDTSYNYYFLKIRFVLQNTQNFDNNCRRIPERLRTCI